MGVVIEEDGLTEEEFYERLADLKESLRTNALAGAELQENIDVNLNALLETL